MSLKHKALDKWTAMSKSYSCIFPQINEHTHEKAIFPPEPLAQSFFFLRSLEAFQALSWGILGMVFKVIECQ